MAVNWTNALTMKCLLLPWPHDFEGRIPLIGLFIRMGDKMQRLKAFSKHGKLQVKSEGVDDALRDLIGYCTLGLAMIEDRKNG